MALNFKTPNSIFESMRAYLQSITTSLTDFNAGSVLNSIFDSVSNAIGNLYASLQIIYDAMFVSTATGTDLDKRVADFTLTRKQATTASGILTFSRSTPGLSDYTIPQGVLGQIPSTQTTQGTQFRTTESVVLSVLLIDEDHVYDIGLYTYDLGSRLASSIVYITGTYNSSAGYLFTNSTSTTGQADYMLDVTTNPYQHKVRWFPAGNVPDDGTLFYVTYNPLSVDATANCVFSGTAGNAGAETIIVMPSSPAGIEDVINYEAFTGGTDSETDDALRARVPAYLASLARATKDALIGAALSVSGVESASVVEPNPPTGFITLYIDNGSGTATSDLCNAVREVIEGTVAGTEAYRGVALGVNVVAPVIQYVDISMVIVREPSAVLATISANITTALTSYMMTLGLTDVLYRSKVIEIAQNVSGVVSIDVATVTLDGYTTGDITPNADETLKAGIITITE